MILSDSKSIDFKKFFSIILLTTTSLFVNGQSTDTVYAEIAAIDQTIMYNRLGAAMPTGMTFALISDLNQAVPAQVPNNKLGTYHLREGKRPRPIVLRANKGNVLIIKFTNLLAPYDATAAVDAYNTEKPTEINQSEAQSNFYPMTRAASIHISGTEYANNIMDGGTWAGADSSGLAQPGETVTYTLIVPEEGTFMLYSTGAAVSNGGIKGGQLTNGLFGSLNVQPSGAEWYRSQVSEEDLDLAITHYEQLADDPAQPNIHLDKSQVPDIYNTENTFPIVDYDAVYTSATSGHKAGDPILKMYTQDRPHHRTLIHTDLTAIITGPDAGIFPYSENDPAFYNVPASPDRRLPYREFGIHYHESPWVVQAFPIFYDTSDSIDYGRGMDPQPNDITNTLKAGLDAFAINYGTGGIGAEIYANRIGVGPMAECSDCAYEEFFLSSWAVGDPAMIVDVPANASANNQIAIDTTLQNQFLWGNGNDSSSFNIAPSLIKPKATKTLYPDDPSNVYHSYMNDHVKFRITHAGAGITHVHHQHAHQWLHSPNSDNGHYMDSQTINPGSSYTLEMVYDGSGNLNKTVGDQIFHCHFYPHFAQGMWSLWRVHDVLELGTELDENGRPTKTSRALPDGEIEKGTPIPGLVPVPTMAMAPVPAKVNIVDHQIVVKDETKSPGYPFFVPGIAGSRPPHPPMDFAKEITVDENGDTTDIKILNGGLPRNVIYAADVPFENHTQYDWTKVVDNIQIIELPEDGTAIEKIAMETHATRNHSTLTSTGERGYFELNGLPPVSGAPFADPAVDINGNPVGTKRVYKAANIQLDVVLNKQGWHYPQQRIISLWGDVSSNIEGDKAPEPFYFRANSGEYVEFWHTNLIPEYYELDDYQVRTPTDVIGQHIHLVKFDVTSSDGAANGWNYEDGTLAPDLVRDRIEAINHGGAHMVYKYTPNSSITDTSNYTIVTDELVAQEPNPVWGTPPSGQDWAGAQTTIQRWYADPLLNNKGEDRTLRTVFTHDHFGPSTHQQIGLYAGLLIEPNQSYWIDPVTKDTMGIANNGVERDVMIGDAILQVSDGGPTGWQANIVTANEEDSYREFMLEFQDNQQAYLPESRGTADVYPIYPHDATDSEYKKFVDSANAYTGWMDSDYAINTKGYPELVSTGALGLYSMNYRNEPVPLRVADSTSGYTNSQGEAGDLSYAFSSQVTRSDARLNSQPTGGDYIPGSSTFKYPTEPLGPGMNPGDPYTPLFRAYENDRIQVRTLVGAHVTSHFFNVHGVNWYFEPSNQNSGYRSTQNMGLSEHFEMNFEFPETEHKGDSSFTDYLYNASSSSTGNTSGLWGLMRAYDTEQPNIEPLPNNKMDGSTVAKKVGCPENVETRTYNVTAISVKQLSDTLYYNRQFNNYDSSAIIFVRNEDMIKPNWEIEPLVLRANAGECVVVNLTNEIPATYDGNKGSYSYATASDSTSITASLETSTVVGMHAELLSYDVSNADGANIGYNATQTADPDESITYEWYAGKWIDNEAVPVEFGSVVLSASDPMEQYEKGLFGALIVEPAGSHWIEDENSHISANVYDANNELLFREFVLQFQDNISTQTSPTTHKGAANQNDSVTYNGASYAINYKSERLDNRITFAGGTGNLNGTDLDSITANVMDGGRYPETPFLIVQKGSPIRMRLLHPGGNQSQVINVHGHVWQEEPYINASTELGYNDESQWFGYRDQIGPLNSFDLVITSAGGTNEVTGDYLYNNPVTQGFQNGVWGIMKVVDQMECIYNLDLVQTDDQNALHGMVSVNPVTGQLPKSIQLITDKGTVSVDVSENGSWSFNDLKMKHLNEGFVLKSVNGGELCVTKEHLGTLKRDDIMNHNGKPGSYQLTKGLGVQENRIEE